MLSEICRLCTMFFTLPVKVLQALVVPAMFLKNTAALCLMFSGYGNFSLTNRHCNYILKNIIESRVVISEEFL